MLLLNPTPMIVSVPQHQPKISAAVRRARRTESINKLSQDAQELIAIRHSLGVSQETFANMLSIKCSRVASYEYGRTNKVPSWILEKARAIQK